VKVASTHLYNLEGSDLCFARHGPALSMRCPNCNTKVLASVERCHVCGTDVGFPNVRAAESHTETAALASRVESARVSAGARGCLDVLEEFGRAVMRSQAVLARSLGDLDALIKKDNALYQNFHSQVRSGSRIPEDNSWDNGRVSAENAVLPNYFDKINFVALSLDGLGVLWWGEYSILLKEHHIAARTSVFEENPFVFCERHRIVAGRTVPAGYRATWPCRQELAMAKLVGKIEKGTEDKFPPILLSQGASRDTADFIECHIFGPLHQASIERVIGPRPQGGDPELIIWKSVMAKLQKLGAIVQET
jgi:hypothetical protein